jgi:hypothetical protein
MSRGAERAFLSFCVAFWSMGLAACVDRFETPSANEGVRDLCGDGVDPDAFDPELEARIDACRAAGPETCAGVIDIRGQLDDTELAVLEDIEGGLGEIEVVRAGMAPEVLGSVELVVVAPYFILNLSIDRFGGAVSDALDTTVRTFDVASNNDDYTDDVVMMEARLESGGQSVSLRSQGGTATLTRSALTEVRGRFEASMYAPGSGAEFEDDVVEGCFHVFVTAPTIHTM